MNRFLTRRHIGVYSEFHGNRPERNPHAAEWKRVEQTANLATLKLHIARSLQLQKSSQRQAKLKVRYDFEYSPTGRWKHDSDRPTNGEIAWSNIVIAELSPHVDIAKLTRLASDAVGLHTLMLSDSDATDAAMQCVAQMPNLQRLFLSNTQITNEGLRCVSHPTSRCRQLKRLTLSGTQITDDGIVGLESLPLLESLILVDTRVSDQAMTHIAQLSKLKILWLDGTLVTDACVNQLLQLPQLGRLHLNRTAITDEGAEQLLGATTLRKLHLADTRVSTEMVARLREELTNAMVWVESGYGM